MMPKYILGARGHDYGKGRVKDIFSLMHQDGCCRSGYLC